MILLSVFLSFPTLLPHSNAFKPVGQFQLNLAERQENNIFATSLSLMKISTGPRRDTEMNAPVLGKTMSFHSHPFGSRGDPAECTRWPTYTLVI